MYIVFTASPLLLLLYYNVMEHMRIDIMYCNIASPLLLLLAFLCYKIIMLNNNTSVYCLVLTEHHCSEQQPLLFQIWAGGIPSNASGTNLDAGRSTWGTGDNITITLLNYFGGVNIHHY